MSAATITINDPLPPEQLIRTIRAHIAAGDKAKDRAKQHYISAGQHLKTLKAEHAGTWAEWEELLKTRIGIGKSRASELMAIGDGSKTAESVAADRRERQARAAAVTKSRLSVVDGENAEPAKRTGGKREERDREECIALYQKVQDAEQEYARHAQDPQALTEDSFLDDEGNFAPVDHSADAACRTRGFLYRAQQSAFGARADKLQGLVCTREMLEAAQEAAAAWTEVCKQPARKPVKHDDRIISPELGERVGRLAHRLVRLDVDLARELADLILQRGVAERLWADLGTGIDAERTS